MSCASSSRYTRFAIEFLILAICTFLPPSATADTFASILRKAAVSNGFAPAESTHPQFDSSLAAIGGKLFESPAISLNGRISCRDCHLDRFGSADGLPVAIGIDGSGEGADRVESGGAIVPRNTLPLWGRGGKGFDVFFWDGKVDFRSGSKISQFGGSAPSPDPLVTLVHLPPVEIREMIGEDRFVSDHKQESVESASELYKAIMSRVRIEEHGVTDALASYFKLDAKDVQFLHAAEAIAQFIRFEFRLRSTQFHRFVFEGAELPAAAQRGGMVFYGKGKCSTCHSGEYLTDFDFHSVVSPQIGFGKNGFGIDYGRFNVTHDPSDLYKFRTPPLFNVTRTQPYGHSGGWTTLEDAIIGHFDPLRMIDTGSMAPLDRHELYKRLASASEHVIQIGYLDSAEVSDLVAFLRTLQY